ncbi:MAG: hypothetical protein WAN11_07530, partial [Syntrophobacteraceae bacterium]
MKRAVAIMGGAKRNPSRLFEAECAEEPSLRFGFALDIVEAPLTLQVRGRPFVRPRRAKTEKTNNDNGIEQNHRNHHWGRYSG